jgi:nucleotide-binding universal stress UspA family protein
VYTTIVVGAHKSESARRALNEATELARALDAHVHLVSAYPKDSGPIDGRDTPWAHRRAANDGRDRGILRNSELHDPCAAG